MYEFDSWQFLAENLKQRGYCVYQFRYGMIPGFPGIGGLTDIQDSAHQLGDYVDKVLASTTASKVDLVGHSEGTVVSRWYAKFLDNQKVRSVVSVSPIGQGTTIQGLLGFSKLVGWYDILANAVHGLCAACTQLLEGSDLLSQLYYTKAGSAEYGSGSDLVPHVQYLSILTNQDQLVTPYTNGLLSIPEAPKGDESTASSTSRMELDPVYSSKNLVLEDYCGMDPEHSNHFGLFQSPFALNAIDAFLTPPSQGQGDSGRPNENWACS
ncbi:hypothetical protein BGW38_005375 [Lunasporangiospora selenospora]|uniref:Triacylglycerol lipase n=1 Tax=Lunasporangiospora selenospora TaxID=979761 RepID=A0A9P6FQ05_9FUNG|nr:hypothetical protein BGW38_005375 [Lunasporangiospora selenospora]